MERYLEQAEDAERLARTAETDREREACLQIAALWRQMAPGLAPAEADPPA